MILYYGLPASDYYEGLQANYDGDGLNANTDYATIVSKFDSLVDNVYVTKSDKGVSSDETNHLYEYDFIPSACTLTNKAKSMPTILIVSGQHGFEKASIYGLYYFLKDLKENWSESPTLEYLRHHVIIKVLPACNPYGIDHNEYCNANGVNLNRNYDTPGFSGGGTPWTPTYGGETAGSEPETQIICSFVEANDGAIILMDYHTNGRNIVSQYTNVNWLDFAPIQSDFFDMFKYWGCSHIERLTERFNGEYALGLTTELCGRVSSGEDGYTATFPSVDVWCLEHDIVGHTIEGFAGFPNRSSYTAEVKKANSEIIGNWITTVITKLSAL